MIRRGTTPTITVTVDADLAGADAVLTLEAGTRICMSPDSIASDGSSSTLTFVPTQEQTLSLKATSAARVQLRWIFGNSAFASEIVQVPIGDVLDERVMRP